ncbi:GTP-binding protein [Calothrix sp. 336/3]|uniref:GTP-binding protein n=1 Tax=Calothrix sp. 336/3 TaxID=1337936 RepID=UPI0004E3D343|nr:ATP/GTP-binding protein [Calothrix sp. 336/3]AKG22563.1 GTPase [Calothrix sp. 336/3]
MEVLRIVIAGGVGAGKTSFIRAISEIEVVDTDQMATDEIAQIKEKTTVALDFGRLTVGKNQSLHLFGTPGQMRFDFMWDILIKKAHAYILLVDAHRPEHIRYGRKILQFMKHRVEIPYLIGITHTDCEGAWELEDVVMALDIRDIKQPPIIAVHAHETESVKQALILLVEYFAECYSIN